MIRRERLLWGAILVGVAGLTIFLVILYLTGQWLNARLAEYEMPESVREYRQGVKAVTDRLAQSSLDHANGLEASDRLSEYMSSTETLRRLEHACFEFSVEHWIVAEGRVVTHAEMKRRMGRYIRPRMT